MAIYRTSSLVAEARYNRKQSTLVVTLHTGESYAYFKVPLGTFNEFANASSLGSFFSRNIRQNPAYPCERVQ